MIHLSLHRSRYPAVDRERLRRAIEARALPGRFLYDSPGQASRWLEYHDAFSPSRTDPDVESMYDRAFRSAVDASRGEPFALVSLGCGGGRKDLRLLRLARGRIAYVPVDTSPSLVAEGALNGRDAAASLDPRVVDLEADLTPDDFGSDGAPRLFTAFGMVPNFDLETFGPRLRSWLRPQDRLLISFNLSPGPLDDAQSRILPQYDNEPGRAWMTGALRELGLFAEDARLRIEAAPRSEDGTVWRVEAWADLLRTIDLPLLGGSERLGLGESLRLLISNRLTSSAADTHLRTWGFDIDTRWIARSNEEGVWLCRPTAEPIPGHFGIETARARRVSNSRSVSSPLLDSGNP